MRGSLVVSLGCASAPLCFILRINKHDRRKKWNYHEQPNTRPAALDCAPRVQELQHQTSYRHHHQKNDRGHPHYPSKIREPRARNNLRQPHSGHGHGEAPLHRTHRTRSRNYHQENSHITPDGRPYQSFHRRITETPRRGTATGATANPYRGDSQEPARTHPIKTNRGVQAAHPQVKVEVYI